MKNQSRTKFYPKYKLYWNKIKYILCYNMKYNSIKLTSETLEINFCKE